ncbi:MAG: hypothetical protein HYY06_18390 [Deltaproteobacteria bacterium]|nr:hypothetical protein [Deltaproteobacteria bacterium]
MGKCPLCGSRKAKRQCNARAAPICPLCCGTSREPAACEGCTFFRAPARRYDTLPRCPTQEMDGSTHLQQIAFPAEAAVCSLDRDHEFALRDAQAIAIFELLLDLYAFGDSRESLASPIHTLQCGSVLDIVERELRPYDPATIARVLATVRFVACRRASGGRHHIDVLHQYCGAFVSTGVGLRILDDGTEMVVARRDL